MDEKEPCREAGKEPCGEAGKEGKEPCGKAGKEPCGEAGKEPCGEAGKEPCGEVGKEPCGEVGKEPCGEAVTTTETDLLLDLKVLRSGFSPSSDNKVVLDGYMEAYIEMNKFLGVLGSIFNMVTSEVKSKVSILQEHRRGGDGDHYATLDDMLSFEQKQANGGVPKEREGRPSGARTLLRLHRSLEFVLEFMKLIMRPKDGFFGGQVSRLYGATLGRHHGMLIRAATSTALLTLPTHATIVQRLMKGKTVMEESLKADMDQMIAGMKTTYDLTQQLYQQYGYLDLP